MTGTQIGGGYEGSLGDMAFWRAEGSYQMWEDIKCNWFRSWSYRSLKNKIDS